MGEAVAARPVRRRVTCAAASAGGGFRYLGPPLPALEQEWFAVLHVEVCCRHFPSG
ncbi:hypothetical protein [Xylella fastidiosa]|uniref:hypothetical protein n=1 Tax=Xylella fastidiosa TaxID=2371 RepID=UPI001F40A993|nr:hypothetical protein [Xylella fastidiosa]